MQKRRKQAAQIEESVMGRSSSRSKPRENEFVLFNVLYEDGAQTSNRRVPRADLGGFDEDAAARAFLEAQDQRIAAQSGRSRGPIKSIERSEP
jgi:hypothetical protein